VAEFTMSDTFALLETHGDVHVQVAVSVSVTVRLLPLVFAGAV
jgi:hypothetical protein